VLKEHLYWLALNAEREETQVRAAQAALDRFEGAPVARNINATADDISQLDDDALVARQAELERELGAGDGGAETPPDPPEPGRIRH
jgi:hypothetical protein